MLRFAGASALHHQLMILNRLIRVLTQTRGFPAPSKLYNCTATAFFLRQQIPQMWQNNQDRYTRTLYNWHMPMFNNANLVSNTKENITTQNYKSVPQNASYEQKIAAGLQAMQNLKNTQNKHTQPHQSLQKHATVTTVHRSSGER